MEPFSFPGEKGRKAEKRRKAYSFDGEGGVREKGWKYIDGGSFCWYNLELPEWVSDKEIYVRDLFNFHPHPQLQNIVSLVNLGSSCERIGGDLIFRLNSPGPYPKLAVLITENTVISICQGDIPLLRFTRPIAADDLEMIPRTMADLERMIPWTMTDVEMMRDRPVPRTITDLVIHIVDAYVDHLGVIVSKMEMDVKIQAEKLTKKKGVSSLKKQMIEDERFFKEYLDIQPLLSVISHGEEVLSMFHNMDAIDGIAMAIAKLGHLKEIVGLLENRVSLYKEFINIWWRYYQINERKFYFSVLRIILYLAAIIAGVMGMRWTSGIMGIGILFAVVMGMRTRR